MSSTSIVAVALRTFWELDLERAIPTTRCRSYTDGCLALHCRQPAEAAESKLLPLSSQHSVESLHSPRSDHSFSECSLHGAPSRASTASTMEDPEVPYEVKLPRAVKVAECLKELDGYEAQRILRVSRLSRAGQGALELLRAHLEKRFGAVERILEVHPPHLSRKIKVSNMVYVVMCSCDAAERALAAGSDHAIHQDTTVLVRNFERKSRA